MLRDGFFVIDPNWWARFLGFWERLGWRYRHEHAPFFSSPPIVNGRQWNYE